MFPLRFLAFLLLIGVTAPAAARAPLPEIRLTAPDAALWDPVTGIYANPRERGRAWERQALLDLRRGDAPPLRTRVGLRIHGGRSRDLDQKSLRVYFDHGDGPVDLDLFGGEPAPVARLILRSAQTPDRMLHTALAESVFQDLGHVGSRLAPVMVTLNDRDWGLYSARERLDDQWVEVTLGWRGDYALIRDGETRHGDGEAWWRFLARFREPDDRSSPAWLAGVERELGLAAYIDWLAILILGAAADNGDAHNLALLRLGGGPWRPILWDGDDLFRPENLHADHLRWFTAADAAEYERYRPPLVITGDWESRGPWAAMLRGLLENPSFRARFFARLEELLDGALSAARLGARLDALVAEREPGLARHAVRWGWSGPGALRAEAAVVKAWIVERQVVVREQLEAFRDGLDGRRGGPR